MTNAVGRLGSVSYFVWGLLHLQAAYSVYKVGASVEAGMVQGRLYQSAWNLLFFSVCAIAVALTLNWRNDRLGYWINAGVITLADTGFIFFVLIPGYISPWPGILGPVFWIGGWILTSIALVGNEKRQDATASPHA